MNQVDYEMICAQLRSLSEGVDFEISKLANASALIFGGLSELNWAGFYLFRNGELVLGPFQGKPACTRIAMGKGVCGTAAANGRTEVVPDVHKFPGHIACDCASNSEIVIPVYRDGAFYGVLDIDSPVFERFSEKDRIGLEQLVKVLEEVL